MTDRLSDLCKRSLTFMGSVTDDLKEDFTGTSLLGLPYDMTSSYRTGARFAPNHIREATSSELMNSYTEAGLDITLAHSIHDYGDLNITLFPPDRSFRMISQVAQNLQERFKMMVFLGGDHFVTYPILNGLSSSERENIGLLYFDAHLDLYSEYQNNKYSHACTLRRIVEKTGVRSKNITVVGARAYPPDQLDYANKKGMSIITSGQIYRLDEKELLQKIGNRYQEDVDVIYLSMDMDVFDPGFAPGVGNPEPGGITPRQLISLLPKILRKPLIGFDIVEIIPAYDVSQLTSVLAAKMIKEILGLTSTNEG